MQYWDLKKNWTKKVQLHLNHPTVVQVLVRDFNRFTMGRSKRVFTVGMMPRDFESCDWRWGHGRKGPEPRYWNYVCHSACHWLVNFSLRLAEQVDPVRSWQIVTSQKHSTVWDGEETLFDFNFQAMEIDADECFLLARYGKGRDKGRVLRVGKEYTTGCPQMPWVK